ncbi:PREDICTED: uncharacterized protein LOC108615484 isoform X2 [Drosophila arizonae]|uniref:Uncharacterized protein LOC108615484 isoform X2 n=1 Tax=Drosophila arizonae TaxID=7263 RepID=A0ABM1PE43_DROAR|nr:PREDICTED: uncharacterized protein LOC108615484 isoform X2 [Drosophila arizonae]
MPIGKVPQASHRKPSSSGESTCLDSTIDSRMSSSELLPMELLKVNYVHQCKQAMMHKSNEPPPPPAHLNNPARFVGYRRQPPQMHSVSQVSAARKSMPVQALPPPTVESWLLLAKQPEQQRRSDDLDDCCCSRSGCSCSDSSSDVTETSTVTPDCEKSQSWNYRDIRRDLARAGAAAGIRSRADRIARIERRECQAEEADCTACLRQPEPVRRLAPSAMPTAAGSGNRGQLRSRIPKPLLQRSAEPSPNSEANAQLQRRVKQLFQQDMAYNHSAAPRWMFQKAGDSRSPAAPTASSSAQQQPRVKLERVHIRKKRQPLHIVNQLASDGSRGGGGGEAGAAAAAECSTSYKLQQQSPKMKQVERAKRFSLESCSDSGVSSSNDAKEQHAKQTNLQRSEKCVSCVQVPEMQLPEKHKQYERTSGTAQPKAHVDPNDVQNFAKKNLTKATTNELLTAAAVQVKQCNIEKERKLNSLKHREAEQPKTSTTTISIDDSWVQESIIDPCDDYMETDSLMLPPPAAARPISKHNNNNSVKIFVCSNGNGEGDKDDHQVDRVPRMGSSAACLALPPSSCASTSSSGCGGSSRDTSSLCESEQDCCSCSGQQPSCLASDCCNAIGGVFWNNACYDIEAEVSANAGAGCCCSISSCDDDDCSYYAGDFSASKLDHIPGRRGELLPRNNNNKLLRKTGIHELRPRSMDGVIDSGVSLNGDTGSSPDNGEHLQNQQDAEARKLKRGHVLTELLETERIYVNEMSSILKGYFDQMQSDELMHLVPASLQGKEEILFGNLHELYTFHNEIFLKDLENCISTTELVALCFVQRRDTFYRLYSFYCQNIPRSDRLRETLVDTHLFLQECQKRLGHKLPLAAYLLKPVQRITKYQLLLKDLLRFSDSGSCTKELQKALDCMLIVLKCVNDSMHQVAITGFPTDLAQQGELLLQDSFQVWTESKKDIRLRIKPQQRHIFLYQKSLLFCKQTSKAGHNKSTYQFKHHVKMSQIGLTESVRGDAKRFEVWLQGRQEVHTLQAPSLEVKNKWVAEIKRVLLNQLEELKGEKIKQYGLNHRGLKQTTSWDTPNIILGTPGRTISCDASSESSNRNSNCSSEENGPAAAACGNSSGGGGMADRDHPEGCGWSSDYSNSEDEISVNEDNSTPGSKFIALADYTAMGHSEVSMREGEAIELLKVGCAGWWYVRVLDTNAEGWTPGAYLESINRKSSRSSSCNQERIIQK